MARIGIMGALAEEVMDLLPLMENVKKETVASREFYTGTIDGTEVVLAFSHWGKVASALTSTIMIERYHITHLVFSGTAGALAPSLNVGDVVVADRLVQHDFNGTPIYERFLIPYLNMIWFKCDDKMHKAAVEAVKETFEERELHSIIPATDLASFGITEPKVYVGDIASGDQFISGMEVKNAMLAALPSLMCAEMEGAAVGQVCVEYGLPFVVIRSISDKADGSAHVDFQAFVTKIAPKYSVSIITKLIRNLRESFA